MLKGYHGPVGAQVHCRTLGPDWETVQPSLLCLPPSPHSGMFFETIMPMLAKERQVIAVDYPGFGGSDPLDDEASIEGFAKCLLPLTQSLGSVDIIGFHTGNLVALELALTHSDLIKRVIMVDVPYFDQVTRQKYDAAIGQPIALPEVINDLTTSFEKNITARQDALGLLRSYDLWVESLRAGERGSSAFHAAFTYDHERAFATLDHSVTIIATQSSLLEPSRQAASVLSQAEIIEHLSITEAVFELGAEQIAKTVLAVLNA